MPDITASQASAATEAIAERMARRALLGARYDAGLARDILGMLVELERDLVGQIAAADITGVARASARRARLDTLLEETRKAIRSTYRRVRVLSENSLDELFGIEADATRAALNASFQDVGVRLGASLPTNSYMAALAEETLVLGRPLSDYWAAQENTLRAAFRAQMELGLQAGETIDQLIRRIRGGTRDGVAMPGIMQASRAHAAALVRTSAASVGNSARFATFEANLDVIDEYVHLSRLDGRTSTVCITRAGKRWNAATREPIGHSLPFQTPPIHINCRSVLVTRVVGGDLPTEQNGEQWFNGLDAATQNQLFGRTRAELFRSGDIDMQQLLDQSGRPLPLSALKTDEANVGDRRAARS
jgi:SPP1 gp7 family putative phage head morphogenesis protein